MFALGLCSSAAARAGVAEQATLPAPPPEPGPTLFVAAGLTEGVAQGLGVVPTARAELRLPQGLSVAIEGGSRTHTTYRESATALLAGYHLGIVRDWFSAWAGIELGAGIVAQTSTILPDAYSGEGIAAPFGGVGVRVAQHTAIALEASLPLVLVRRDGAAAALALPAAWLGAVVDL